MVEEEYQVLAGRRSGLVEPADAIEYAPREEPRRKDECRSVRRVDLVMKLVRRYLICPARVTIRRARRISDKSTSDYRIRIRGRHLSTQRIFQYTVSSYEHASTKVFEQV